jgi:hypothetical protein
MFIACGQSPIYRRILGCLRRDACYKRHDCLQEMQLLREKEEMSTRDISVRKGCFGHTSNRPELLQFIPNISKRIILHPPYMFVVLLEKSLRPRQALIGGKKSLLFYFVRCVN